MKILSKNISLLIILSILGLTINKIGYWLLKVESLVFEDMATNISLDQAKKINSVQQVFEYLNYILTPLLLFLKTSIISLIIYLGVFLFGNGASSIDFKNLWRISLKAEFVFLLVPTLKILWFYFFNLNYTLKDLQYFSPLSALNIVGYQGLDVWWIYPFQTLNLFEVAYWIILGYLLGKELKIATEKGLKIVASSYGVSLLIWVVGVMFFTLNMS
ncbi:MAG: hypothetical protein KDC52_17105 [Ignavibacteriae bacterium]|nr:hypothetical protein [Ignavibacteriota bacterium]